ncbi:hypothetical protein [Gryllotalpicola koreensis]|uniref:DUF222 domain-containing protein n=1 Tax=Gryllotalpicola koreensis TaxID=993086 RepID=A0ABP8A263_9MICO
MGEPYTPSIDEREKLKTALTDGYWKRTGYRVSWEHLGPLVDAILESDWLAAHDADVRAKTLREIADLAEADTLPPKSRLDEYLFAATQATRERAEKAEAERDALAAQLAKAKDYITECRARNMLPRALTLLDILDADPFSLLAERDARMRAEGGKQALLSAASQADSAGHYWSGAPAKSFFDLADGFRARAEQEHQPLDSEVTNG